MFDWIESIAQQYSHTIHVLAALGTWFAACVALYLGRRAYSYNIKGDVRTYEKHTSNGVSGPYVVLLVQNRGNRPLILNYSSFFWTIPFFKAGVMQNPRADFHNPCIVNPNMSKTVILGNELSVERLRESLKNIRHHQNCTAFFLKKFLRLTVIADDGTKFNFDIEKSLKNKLISDR